MGYAMLLGVLLFAVQWLQYRYSIHAIPTYWLIVLVATLFVPMGLWLGIQALRPHIKKKNRGTMPFVSKREQEVLDLVCKGFSNQEIADALFISVTTVKSHVSNLLLKFDAKRRTQLIHRCREKAPLN